MRKLLWLIMIMCSLQAMPQQLSFDDFKKLQRDKFNSYKDSLQTAHNQYREKLNKEYAEFLDNPWENVRFEKPTPIPPTPKPVVQDDENIKILDNTILKIDTIYVPLPVPLPQPRPIVPIYDDRQTDPLSDFVFSYFGTKAKVRDIGSEQLRLYQNKSLSEQWMAISNANADGLVIDLLNIRDNNNLCDWAFRGVVESLCKEMLGESDMAILLNGYLMTHAGYNVRFVKNSVGKLFLGYNTDFYLYNLASVWNNGATYYIADPKFCSDEMTVTLCDYAMPGEQGLSMRISNVQKFDLAPSKERIVRIKYHNAAGDTIRAAVNSNLIAFYDTYPKVWRDQLSSWQIVSEFPADPYLTDQLYPQLRKLIAGMDQQNAVNTLIGVCQSFPYGYDDEIWGYDYPLTIEQTWFHSQSDCEDHAIHLARLVRDLLGLRTALIYLPGHLVTGIVFTDSHPEGSRVECNGLDYLICDPTYFGEKIGKTFVATDTDETCIYLIN